MVADVITALYHLADGPLGTMFPAEVKTQLGELAGKTNAELKAQLRPAAQTRFDYVHRYAVAGDDGEIRLVTKIVCGGEQPAFLPRLGVTLALPGRFRARALVRPWTARELRGPQAERTIIRV